MINYYFLPIFKKTLIPFWKLKVKFFVMLQLNPLLSQAKYH